MVENILIACGLTLGIIVLFLLISIPFVFHRYDKQNREVAKRAAKLGYRNN